MSDILVLGGSIRARLANRSALLELGASSGGVAGFQNATRKLLCDGTSLCNSEILAAAALAGAMDSGASVDYFPLVHLFPRQPGKWRDGGGEQPERDDLFQGDSLALDAAALSRLLEAFDAARGIILATPVYFGDRSSVANKFLQLASVRARAKGKVCGVVSVGAKRNGGQETCDIYSLYEMLGHGALGVGNGMPTSQYGGTAVGGDKGRVAEDGWGLSTAFGTGARVGQVSRMYAAGVEADGACPARIAMLVAMDSTTGKLLAHVKKLVARVRELDPRIDISIINLVEHDIFRCLGCKVCPQMPGEGRGQSRCAITDPSDYLETARRTLLDADGFMVCGYNPMDFETLITRYQVFTERMRFIRRSDYELSNKLVAGLCYHEFGATFNPIHSVKVMTSYVRHNTVLHRPVEIFEYRGELLDSGLDGVVDFCRAAAALRCGRELAAPPSPVYDPFGEGGGYSENGQD